MRCCINKTVSISSDPFELTGVVWSVGESGDFDYSKLPVEKSKRLRSKIGRNVDRWAFRLNSKPLNLMDNAK